MRKFMRKSGLLFLAVVLTPHLVISATVCEHNEPITRTVVIATQCFELNDETKEAELCCQSIDWGNWSSTLNLPTYNDRYIIPDYVTYEGTDYAVTGIKEGVFWNRYLSSLRIPPTVKRISGLAFGTYDKAHIKNLDLPSLEWWLSVDLTDCRLPENDRNKDYRFTFTDSVSWNPLSCSEHVFFGGEEYDMTQLTIPEGTIEIKKNLFRDCIRLKDLVLPTTLRKIGSGAFAGVSLSSIKIPGSVEEIGPCAFNGRQGFYKDNCSTTKLIFETPSSLKTIGRYAFERNIAIRSVAIPESVVEIHEHAFSNIPLISLDMGDGLVELSSDIFDPWYIKHLWIGKNCSLSASKEFLYELHDRPMRFIVSRKEKPLPTDFFDIGKINFDNAMLFVPEDAVEAYTTTGSWANFKTIQPGNLTFDYVVGIRKNEADILRENSIIYNLQGRRMDEAPSKGLYIQGGKVHIMKP